MSSIILSGLLLAIVGFGSIYMLSDEYIESSMRKDIKKHFDEFYN